MFEFIPKLIDILSSLEFRKLLKLSLSAFIISLLIYPILERNFFSLHRIEKKTELLVSLSSIPQKRLITDNELNHLYSHLIEELVKADDSINFKEFLSKIFYSPENFADSNTTQSSKIIETEQKITLWKFFSGGFIIWLLIFVTPFVENYDVKGKLASAIILLIIGLVFGFLSIATPTFFNPIINYSLFPIGQIGIIAYLVWLTQKKESKGTDEP